MWLREKLVLLLLPGGLKLWEGSLDLVKKLHSEIEEGVLMLSGKRVLEVGCLIRR